MGRGRQATKTGEFMEFHKYFLHTGRKINVQRIFFKTCTGLQGRGKSGERPGKDLAVIYLPAFQYSLRWVVEVS